MAAAAAAAALPAQLAASALALALAAAGTEPARAQVSCARSGPGPGGTCACPARRHAPSRRIPPWAPPSAPAGADPVTFATFNAEWLFDGENDPPASPWKGAGGGGDCPGAAVDGGACDASAAEKHIARVAEVVARVRPDVLAVVEAESCDIVRRVGAAAALIAGNGTGLDETNATSPWEVYLVEGSDSFLRQQVALLTTVDPIEDPRRTNEREDFPMPGSTCGSTAREDDTGVSKNVIARFVFFSGSGSAGAVASAASSANSSALPPSAVPVTVISAHLKAIPTEPRSCAQREAQAAVLAREAAAALAAGDEVVLMGDINDFFDNGTLADVASSRPTSSVFNILQDPDNDGAVDLLPAMALLPPSSRYTAWWDHAPKDGIDEGITEHSMLDHILMSKHMYDAISRVWVDHTHDPAIVSDHWPIAATVDMERVRVARASPASGSAALGRSHPGQPAPRGPRAGVSVSTLTLSCVAGTAALAACLLGVRWHGRRARKL